MNHCCIACRDFSALDSYVTKFTLSNIKANSILDDEVPSLQSYIDAIRDPAHVESVRCYRDKLAEIPTNLTPKEQEVASKLWRGRQDSLQKLEAEDKRSADAFALGLFRKCVKQGLVTGMNDHVGRARIFCVWLAGSVTYEWGSDAMADDSVFKLADYFRADLVSRTPGKVRPTAFCAGYANLFVEMFNSVTQNARLETKTSEDFLARATFGVSKYSSRASVPKYASPADLRGFDEAVQENELDAHAWAVFPTAVGIGWDPTEWKVIDPCWIADARKVAQGTVASQWFSNSNQTILRTHWSNTKGDRLPPADFQPAAGGTMKQQEEVFKDQDLAPFEEDIVDLQIEESSLNPQAYLHTPRKGDSFSFNQICPNSSAIKNNIYLIPVQDNRILSNEVVKFDVYGRPAKYNAIIDTAALADKFKGNKLSIHIAEYTLPDNGNPSTWDTAGLRTIVTYKMVLPSKKL